MKKKYKIVVSDMVLVAVSGATTDEAGKAQPFKFSLTCKRMAADELGDVMAGEANLREAVKKVATGWDGQRLVLEDDGTPAEFNEDSLDALLSISQMSLVCFTAYHKATSAAAKN